MTEKTFLNALYICILMLFLKVYLIKSIYKISEFERSLGFSVGMWNWLEERIPVSRSLRDKRNEYMKDLPFYHEIYEEKKETFQINLNISINFKKYC